MAPFDLPKAIDSCIKHERQLYYHSVFLLGMDPSISFYFQNRSIKRAPASACKKMNCTEEPAELGYGDGDSSISATVVVHSTI
jgi:hypothetical protein